MYGLRHDIENLEEEIQELETKQENAVAELDYVLELLAPVDQIGIDVDVNDFLENVFDAIKVVQDIIKELK